MDIAKYFTGIRLNNSPGSPLYQQIAEIVTQKIKSRELPPGTRLLPERDLAVLFGVSRTTAINAYRLLEQEGLVRTRVGSGTYVADQPAEEKEVPWAQLFKSYNQSYASSVLREMVSASSSRAGIISFATGSPDPHFFPVQTLADLFSNHISSASKADFGYIPTDGYGPLRWSICEMLKGKGITSRQEEVMVVSGSQQGLYLLSKALLEPGDYVVMESPTFLGAIQAFQAAGAKILGIDPSDTHYLSLLEDYIIRYRPKFLYIMPTFHNPTGSMLPLKDRQDLLALAARHRLVIVEDDPYGDLYFEKAPPPSLKALDSYGGVVYLGTFSKILIPGLKIGYLAAPAILIKKMSFDKQYVDLNSNNFTQWLLHRYLEEGWLGGHLDIVRKEYKKRRDAMARALRRFCEGVEFDFPGGGYYIWCRLKEEGTVSRLLHEAVKNGISFVPGDAFYASAALDKEFRLCFATHDEAVITEGVRRLGKALSAVKKEEKESPRPLPAPPIV
ncbi:MAG: GntR family transcriptional regulator [Peptococcaceae bacterium BICA1-7]|nr:MAG: GntR family transcriptional regulator [Peptococcaceae bacterium BICA1-7]HBV98651.1 PLP-dependent aminotransferase family protein [Desulfotomaculum sp.]